MAKETKQEQINKLQQDYTIMQDKLNQQLEEAKKLREQYNQVANPDTSQLIRLEADNAKLMKQSSEQLEAMAKLQTDNKRIRWALFDNIVGTKKWKYVVSIIALIALGAHVGNYFYTGNITS